MPNKWGPIWSARPQDVYKILQKLKYPKIRTHRVGTKMLETPKIKIATCRKIFQLYSGNFPKIRKMLIFGVISDLTLSTPAVSLDILGCF